MRSVLTYVLTIGLLFILSCSTHNYKVVTQPMMVGGHVNILGMELYCAETCFKTKAAFFTGRIEFDTRNGDVTCYCKKRTTDYSGPVE